MATTGWMLRRRRCERLGMATLIRTEGRMIVATGEARTISEVLDILEDEVVVANVDAA